MYPAWIYSFGGWETDAASPNVMFWNLQAWKDDAVGRPIYSGPLMLYRNSDTLVIMGLVRASRHSKTLLPYCLASEHIGNARTSTGQIHLSGHGDAVSL